MFALVSEFCETVDETSAVQFGAVVGAAEIDSSLGAFVCIATVAVELNWTLLRRFLAGTVCS